MVEIETQGFLSTEFNRKNVLDAVAEFGSQVEGLKDTANKNVINTNIYRDRVGDPLAMCNTDVNEDDRNDLSTDGSPRTEINTTAATANTTVDTRVNTTREMTRQLQRKTKHKQAMDIAKKRKLTMGIHHGILTPLIQYWEFPSMTWCQLIKN